MCAFYTMSFHKNGLENLPLKVAQLYLFYVFGKALLPLLGQELFGRAVCFIRWYICS